MASRYGYACRDGIEGVHLAKVERVDHATTTACAYIWVDDAQALHPGVGSSGCRRTAGSTDQD